jgi:hypothetical protein
MIVGHWQGGSLVLTNAHVAGSQVGRMVVVEVESLNNRRFNAKVIRAAYSNSVSADWALLHIDGFQDIKPVYISKGPPDSGEQLWTKGFPRCRPFAGQKVTQHATLNNGVLLWLPDAIGGQSGSLVVDIDDQVGKALLTWSMTRNGRSYGAGQLTAEIYRQNRSAELRGFPKMPGLVELPSEDTFDFGDIDRSTLTDPVVEEGFFSIPMERNIQDFPIWAEDQKPEPGDDGDDDQPPSGNNAAGIESLRKIRDLADDEIKKLEKGVSNPVDPNDNTAIEDTFGL